MRGVRSAVSGVCCERCPECIVRGVRNAEVRGVRSVL